MENFDTKLQNFRTEFPDSKYARSLSEQVDRKLLVQHTVLDYMTDVVCVAINEAAKAGKTECMIPAMGDDEHNSCFMDLLASKGYTVTKVFVKYTHDYMTINW